MAKLHDSVEEMMEIALATSWAVEGRRIQAGLRMDSERDQ